MAVGPLVLAGIRENRPYIFTGEDVRRRIEARLAAIDEDIARHEKR
jgi:hypothetical protein